MYNNVNQMKYANDTRLKTELLQIFGYKINCEKLEFSFTNATRHPFDSLDDSLRV